MPDGNGLKPEVLEKLETLVNTLQDIQISPEYTLATQALVQAQKDNFEMLDRSLSMIQAIHNAESKNSDFYTELIKYLIPLFTTAAIAGATITVQNINSLVLMIIGIAGVAISFMLLIPLLMSRHRRAIRQRGEYEKLAKVFEAWKSIADMQRKSNGEYSNIDDAKAVSAQFSDLIGSIESFKPDTKKTTVD